MEEFVDNVKTLINALGYKVMEPLLQTSGDTPDERLVEIAPNKNDSGVPVILFFFRLIVTSCYG